MTHLQGRQEAVQQLKQAAQQQGGHRHHFQLAPANSRHTRFELRRCACWQPFANNEDKGPCRCSTSASKLPANHQLADGISHLPRESPKLIPSASLPPTTHSMTAPVTPLAAAPPPWLRPLLSAATASAAGRLEAAVSLAAAAPAAAIQSPYCCRQSSTAPADRGSRNRRLRASSWRSSPLCCHLRARHRRPQIVKTILTQLGIRPAAGAGTIWMLGSRHRHTITHTSAHSTRWHS
jgi:hypothetical protein